MTLRWEVILSLRRRRAVLSECSCVQLSVQAAVVGGSEYAFSPLLGDALRVLSASVLLVMPSFAHRGQKRDLVYRDILVTRPRRGWSPYEALGGV